MASTVRGDFIIIYLVIFAGVSFQINSLALILKGAPVAVGRGGELQRGQILSSTAMIITDEFIFCKWYLRKKAEKPEKFDFVKCIYDNR